MNIGKNKFLYSKELETKKDFKIGSYAPILPLLKILNEKESLEEETKNQNCEKRCLHKGHYSKKDAKTMKNSLKKERGILLREYHCDKCNYWHLTHKRAFRHRKRYEKDKNKDIES